MKDHDLPNLSSGTIVANRFVVERKVQAGGMGAIYKARDLQTNSPVALKLMLRSNSEFEERRFVQEARVLSQLSHPGIVSYVAHGSTAEGRIYLAMTWLDGQTLSERLATAPLTVSESVLCIRTAATALQVAHDNGIVHRDVKPSNLFLRGGLIEQTTLLDFGIARVAKAERIFTQTGAAIGTPAYMAPEQVRADRNIAASADIFSLGCVFFECLTGRPPFVGGDNMALLAKILCEEATPLRIMRPELPAELEQLVARMLAKDPARRPQDAQQLLVELMQLGPFPADGESATAPLSQAHLAVSHGELRIACVVFATAPDASVESAQGTASEDLSTMDSNPPGEPPEQALDARRQSLDEVANLYGGQREWLANGALVVTFSRQGSAADQVSQAARAALTIKKNWPQARVVMSTGRALFLEQGVPIGEALDRCGQLLRDAETSTAAERIEVIVDEDTVDLVDSKFELLRTPTGQNILLGWSETTSNDESRLLLGKPTPCLGRDRELALLTTAFSCSVEAGTSAIVLVVASPGMGKSRLRHEFLRRLRQQQPATEILFGQGDPMRANTPYSLVRHALRNLCGVCNGAVPGEAQELIRRRVGQNVPPAQAQYVSEFIGELCGVPFPDSILLRAARQDPLIMSDQVAQAFVTLLQAECAAHPVLLVLDDLQWGDALAVKLVDIALRELPEQPLMVLALARPEVEELFPRLWKDRNRQEIQLGALPRKGCERLIHLVLGKDATPALVARLIEQSAGNAIFLEELIRAAAANKSDELPQSVLAILHSRLMQLDPAARRLLRAASIFGETFWLGGLHRLIGRDQTSEQVVQWLAILVAAEVVEERRHSRFIGETQYSFRHGLMREAAYSMLPEADLRKGHYLAGCYLSEIGELEPMVLATHFERGGDPARAAEYYMHAGEQAFESNDVSSALARVERGLDCHPEGEVRGCLLALQASCWAWSFRNEAKDIGIYEEAESLLPKGSKWWCSAVFEGIALSTVLGQREQVVKFSERLISVTPKATDVSHYIGSLAIGAMTVSYLADRQLVSRLLARIEQVGLSETEMEPAARGLVHYAIGRYMNVFEPEPYKTVECYRNALSAFQEIGNRRGSVSAAGDLGLALARLGASQEGEVVLREGIRVGQQLKEPLTLGWVQMFLALVLAVRPDESACAEAIAIGESLRSGVGEQTLYGGIVNCALAAAYLRTNDLAAADRSARSALQALAPLRTSAPLGQVMLIRVLLAQGQTTEALRIAREGGELLQSLNGAGSGEVPLLLAIADAHAAAGELANATAVRSEAQAQIELRAARIPDAAVRASYLLHIAPAQGPPPMI